MPGSVLMVRLHEAAEEVTALLARVCSANRPPLTSQDRRRAADDAERATAALAAVCVELDAWVDAHDAPHGAPRRAAEEPAHGAADDAPSPVGTGDDARSAALGEVLRTQEVLDRGRSELDGAVEAARAHGASWREIGEALGIAAQTAHKRFDPRARRRHADYMRDRYRRLRGADDPVPLAAPTPSAGDTARDYD